MQHVDRELSLPAKTLLGWGVHVNPSPPRRVWTLGKVFANVANLHWQEKVSLMQSCVVPYMRRTFEQIFPRITLSGKVNGSSAAIIPVRCVKIQTTDDSSDLCIRLQHDRSVLGYYRSALNEQELIVFVFWAAGEGDQDDSHRKPLRDHFRGSLQVDVEQEPSPPVGCDAGAWWRKDGVCVAVGAASLIKPPTPVGATPSPLAPVHEPASLATAVSCPWAIDKSVSFFETTKGLGSAAPPRTISLLDFLSDVQNGRWKDGVEAACRHDKAPTPSTEQFAKDRLPGIKPSGIFTGLRDASLQRHSGIIALDFDAKDNPATNLLALRLKLRDDFHVVAYHVSTRGAGLAVYVAVAAEGIIDHKQCFKAAKEYFRAEHGIIVDSSGANVGRNRYVSADEQCWWRTTGAVVPFEPLDDSEPEENGCDVRSNNACDVIYEKESSPLSPLSGVSGPESVRPQSISGLLDDTSSEMDDETPDDAPPPSADWPSSLVKIFERWLGRVTPHAGSRNATLVQRVPILLSVVGRNCVRVFMVRFYNDHRNKFSDYPLAQWERETQMLIAACVTSYADNFKVNLNAAESALYLSIKDRENLCDTFRICRSLARSNVNHGRPFSLTDEHLAMRLGCHPQVAARQLDYLEKMGAIKMTQKGLRRQKGLQPVWSKYRWLLTSGRRLQAVGNGAAARP